MNKQKVVSIISKIAEIKKYAGLKIIDVHSKVRQFRQRIVSGKSVAFRPTFAAVFFKR